MPRSQRVIYPGLPSHPQHDLCKKQMLGGGPIVAFEPKGGKEAAFALMNKLELIDISNNLGDAKSLITHPWTTTHASRPAEEKIAMGITEGLLRLSVGLEDGRGSDRRSGAAPYDWRLLHPSDKLPSFDSLAV